MARTKVKVAAGRLLAVITVAWLPLVSPAAPLDQILNLQAQSQKEASQSQAKIDKLADQTEELAAKYKNSVAELDNLRIYNDQIEKLVNAQRQQILSVGQQLNDIDNTEHQIAPLIQRMLASLDAFVKADFPFLMDERQQRLQKLHAAMDDAGLSVSEKFRQLILAYQIEVNYGRTVAAYRGELTEGGVTRAVDFLRVGRIALMYRSPDGKDTGYWDNQQRRWVAAGDKYNHLVETGLHIARREGAPDLIEVPVPAPVTAHE
jgi:hypothetical protein